MKPSANSSKLRARRGEAQDYCKFAAEYKGYPCLPWPFSTTRKGYAKLGANGEAHREVCRIRNGEPPTPKHEAAHLCGKGHEACVAGGHLVWKLRADNHADKVAHDTHRRGERTPGARLTEPEARAIYAAAGTHQAIADAFGCGRTTVTRIKNKTRWGWL